MHWVRVMQGVSVMQCFASVLLSLCLWQRREEGYRPPLQGAKGPGERWFQCHEVVVQEGRLRSDGRRSRKRVECGKWRR